MGFQKRWDVSNICQQISNCRAEVVSPYNDGYNAWSCKQDLYRIKYFLDDVLDMSYKFVGEEEFIKQLEHEKLITKLKNDIQ